MPTVRFSHFASENPDVIAVVEASGREWSRGELARSVKRLSHTLRKLGSVPGDALATMAPNCAEYMIAYLAATEMGMYFVPINWHLAPAEIEYILKDCKPRALVAHERFQTSITSILSGMDAPPPIRLSIGTIAGFIGLAELEDVGDAANPMPIDGRMLAYTSATTGRPKGVLLPLQDAGRILDKIIGQRIAAGLGVDDNVHLCASMLYHGAPLETVAIALHMGHSVVLIETATPEGILRLIEQYRVTTAYIPPNMFKRLLSLSASTRARYSTATLVRVIHAGAPCPVEVKRQMIEWWGPIILELYGAVEGSGTIVNSHDWLKHPGTVGTPVPGSIVKILGEDGEELPAGAVGTIYLTRYTGDRFEYLHDPEKTRSAYRGELFTVGDVGYLNEQGFLFLCDRKIDMINVAGMKIYSAEIENVLNLHPQVEDCAVVGVPDEVTGEAVLALVQVAAGSPQDDGLIADLSRFLRRHLSPLKMPRSFELVSSLPREVTGKLRKRQLRADYLSRHALS